jgi:hypothetical protein
VGQGEREEKVDCIKKKLLHQTGGGVHDASEEKI